MAGTAVLILIVFITATTAFVLFLAARDRARAGSRHRAVQVPQPPGPEGTVYGLSAGGRYVVVRPFTDCYGNVFAEGERLTFRQRHFLPYHGGHTIVFEERPMYLQEDMNREVLDRFADYVTRVS